MKKLALLLALLIVCLNFAACERKCQCVEVSTLDQIGEETVSDKESNGTEDSSETNPEDTPEDSSETNPEDTPEDSSETNPEDDPEDGPGPNHDKHNEIGKYRYINYLVYDRWNFALADGTGACIVWNNEELMELYKKTGYAVLDRYDKEYFTDNALVFATVVAGSGSAMLNVKHLRMIENTLEITVTYRMGENGTCDMQYATYIIEVEKAALCSTVGEDIETQPKVVIEHAYCSQLYQKDDTSKEEDFEYYNFNGYIQPIEKSNMFYNHGWLEIISDEYELGRFLDRYTPTDDLSENLISFADKLKTDLHFGIFDFFAEKAIIAIPYYLSEITGELTPNAYYNIKNIVVSDDAVELYLCGEQECGIFENGVQLAVVDKEILQKNSCIVYYDHLKQETND